MPTSVHIPDQLLKQADKRAKALGISRNRLIVQALTRELQANSEWPPGFIDSLRDLDADTVAAAEEMHRNIVQGRRSKRPVQF